MSPTSRPPLTSRIRASFEGKRKSDRGEGTSPTNPAFITQDPEAFRNAIDAAINSAEFQNAIAANLARIIKPSIKDALDTLQPLVESVYTHEVLLRKTNKSLENLLLRVDTGTRPATRNGEITPQSPGSPGTPKRRGSSDPPGPPDLEQFKASLDKNNKRTVATLAELSNAVENNNKRIGQVVVGITGLQASLAPTKAGLDALKTSSEQSNTTTAVVQAQLDQLNADVCLLIEAVGADLGKNVTTINEHVAEHPKLLASHATKLDAITTDLAALKGQAEISQKVAAIAAELETLRTTIEASTTSSNDHFAALDTQVGSVLSAVEAHGGSLSEIKDAGANQELLAAVQQSNHSHAANAVLLDEIKERSLQPVSEPAEPRAGGGDSAESLAALQGLKDDIAAMRANLDAGISSHGENLTGLGTKVDSVLSTIEEHHAANPSADILAAVQKSNDSHAAHAEALEAVKSIGREAPVAAEPSTASYDTNFAALEAQLASLHASMASHSGSLDEIKAANASTSQEIIPVEGSRPNSGEFQSEVAIIIGNLDAHTALLNELRDNVSAEILTALHDVGQAQASHSTLLAELRESDVSDEILTALHSANDSHAGHSTALEELKSTRSIEPETTAAAPDSSALEAQIAALVSTLEEHKTTLSEIKDATIASNESHAAHATSLGEIQSRSLDGAPSGGANTDALEAQINKILASLEEHKTTLSELKEATSGLNDFHAGQTATLDEIKTSTAALTDSHALHASTLDEVKDATMASNESHAAHTATLEELKSVQPRELSGADDPPSPDIGALEVHLNAVISTLESQNVTLADIKTATTSDAILTAVKENYEILTSHGSLLESISGHSVLVKDLHEETKASHSNLSTTIGALALGGAAGAGATALATNDDDKSAEILEEVKAVRALVETSAASVDSTKDTVTSLASQLEINHTTITTSITTLSDELKAEIDATGTQITESLTTLNGHVTAIDISTLNSAIDGCTVEVKTLTASVKQFEGHVQTTGGKVDGLSEGVHFSDCGVDQLKEHSSVAERRPSMAEGAWFKKASPSTSYESLRGVDESAVDGGEPQYNYLSPVLEVQTPASERDEPIQEEETPPVAEDEALAEEPLAEAPVVEEPMAEEAVLEEAILEEPILEEPVADDPEPMAQKPAVEEPPADDAIEEAVTEAPIPENPSAEAEHVSEAAKEEPESISEEMAEPAASEEPPAIKDEPIPEEPAAEAPAEPAEEIPVAVEEPAAKEFPNEEPEASEEPTVSEVPPPAVDDSELEHSIIEATPVVEESPAAEEAETPEPIDEASIIEDTPSQTEQITEPETSMEEHHIPDHDPLTTEEHDLKGKEPEPISSALAQEINSFDEETPLSPSTETETESASTSAFASPSGPLSPLSPTSKKAKKGKKEKKEKGGKKGKKEKVPFSMDGDEPEE